MAVRVAVENILKIGLIQYMAASCFNAASSEACVRARPAASAPLVPFQRLAAVLGLALRARSGRERSGGDLDGRKIDPRWPAQAVRGEVERQGWKYRRRWPAACMRSARRPGHRSGGMFGRPDPDGKRRPPGAALARRCPARIDRLPARGRGPTRRQGRRRMSGRHPSAARRAGRVRLKATVMPRISATTPSDHSTGIL